MAAPWPAVQRGKAMLVAKKAKPGRNQKAKRGRKAGLAMKLHIPVKTARDFG